MTPGRDGELVPIADPARARGRDRRALARERAARAPRAAARRARPGRGGRSRCSRSRACATGRWSVRRRSDADPKKSRGSSRSGGILPMRERRIRGRSGVGMDVSAQRATARFYGQHGEDLLLAAMLDDVAVGTFAEVGCIDGLRFSNTLHFEQRGWRGLCVEAHCDYIDLLRGNRPGSMVVHAAASEKDAAEVTFYANRRGSLSSLDRNREGEFERRFREYFTGYEQQNVPMRRLDSMLTEAGFDRDRSALRRRGRARSRGVARPRTLSTAHHPGGVRSAGPRRGTRPAALAARLSAAPSGSIAISTTRGRRAVADRVRGRRFSSLLVHIGHPSTANRTSRFPASWKCWDSTVHRDAAAKRGARAVPGSRARSR